MTATQPSDDHLRAYTAVHQRIAMVVSDSTCRHSVPACPGWRIHDVLAHLGGLCEDWVDHRLDGYASEDWTTAQVDRHRDRSCAQILTLWAESLSSFSRLREPLFGSPPARWAFGDAVVHEADIRGALDRGRVPDDAVALALDGTTARWHRDVLSRAGLPALHVQTDDYEWWLGDRDDPDAVILAAPLYELFRALAGRRNEDQVRAWEWSSDPQPYIAAGLPYPFRWSVTALLD
jgi:uncharacterized protein (TIGR03083 family)